MKIYVNLIIFYPQADFLYDKFEELNTNKINILEIIKPKKDKFIWEHPDFLDFSNSTLINLEDNFIWEQNKRSIVLKIDNINILFHDKHNSESLFQLTENVYSHLGKLYEYGLLGKSNPEDKFIEDNKNFENSFGPIRFTLYFDHFYEKISKYKIHIIRFAYLKIIDNENKLGEAQIIKIAQRICLLMSFFWQKSIDYFIGKVNVIDNDFYKAKKIITYSNHDIDDDEFYILKDMYPSIYDFINEIDFEKYSLNIILFLEIVPRLIKTKTVDEISSFMILFNILEKIRNYCKKNPVFGEKLTIKEEYQFVKNKKSTNQFIKKKLEEIAIIVEEIDKKEYLETAGNKTQTIKKTKIKNQFRILFEYFKIDIEKYNIDFNELISYRNKIYHGNIPDISLKKFNNEMIIIIYDLLLKIIKY